MSAELSDLEREELVGRVEQIILANFHPPATGSGTWRLASKKAARDVLASDVIADMLAAARAESQDAGLRERIEALRERVARFNNPTGWRQWRYMLAREVPTLTASWVWDELNNLLNPDALPAPTRADVDQQDDHGANGGRYGGEPA